MERNNKTIFDKNTNNEKRPCESEGGYLHRNGRYRYAVAKIQGQAGQVKMNKKISNDQAPNTESFCKVGKEHLHPVKREDYELKKKG